MSTQSFLIPTGSHVKPTSGPAKQFQLKRRHQLINKMERGLYKMGCRLPVTTYYRTMSIDNKPTTIIIGPSEYCCTATNAEFEFINLRI